MIEQRPHFGTDNRIVWCGVLEPSDHIGRLVLERVLEEIARASTLFAVH
jgi:hypothetical protein